MIFLANIFDVIGEWSPTEVNYQAVAFAIFWVLLFSLVILVVYRFSYQTTVYNKSFAISLPIVAMVTTMIIITVSSNLILSLGMVGALSIVRFRTALKNPFDTVFMFWAVGLGISVGANLFVLAGISTLSIGLLIIGLNAFEMVVSSYFLIIRTDSTLNEEDVLNEVKAIYRKYTLRNKTIKDGKMDLTLEVRSKQDKSTTINAISEIEGVTSVILLSHQGDYISE